MSIRNSIEIGENLFKIANLLLSNARLGRILKYTDMNPFSKEHEDVPQKELLHNNIKVIPLVKEDETNTESVIVIIFNEEEINDNKEFKDLYFDVMDYTPLSQWAINDINLRPFLIMSEIEKKLKDIRVESVGKIKYHGFELQTITDLMSCYRMEFTIEDVYN
jgi:hypothetical protein